MRTSPGRLTLALALLLGSLEWFAACGGETGRHAARSSAGESGTVDELAGNGGERASQAGSASVTAQGGAALESGGSAWGGAPNPGTGGAGGVTTALGGDPNAADSNAGGAAGVTASGGAVDVGGAAGEAGAAGAPPTCCQPLHCADVIPGLDCALNPFRDGCGASFFCGCAQGDECKQNECVACDAGADPCAADAGLCGATTDRCGNAINCADHCADSLGPLGTCYGGRCCERTKTVCATDDCGFMSDGCGGFIDCTGNACQAGTCQLSGKCCTPSAACAADDCGFKSDGCGNYLDCGDACSGDTLCLENRCRDSVCKLGGFECELAYNPAVDGYEYCGTCPQGQGCFRHQCLPLCSAPGP